MTDISSFTPSDPQAATDGVKSVAAEKTKQAKEAVSKAVKSARETATEVAQQTRTFATEKAKAASEKAKVGAAWTAEKAKVAHHAAEEHPLGVAVGAFAIGLGVGFLIARNLD
ncbi:hypothetical protein [Caulobacter sp. 1776]|uniref:hypothetical protein n=1 Tax=Caulobacter sp. 1776 TaxID=3156420 RepID=UPI00339744BF